MSDEPINPADASLPSTLQELSQSDTLHLAAIGMVASSWAGFEVLIDTFALQLARARGSWGYCFTAQVLGPARKLDAYIALARLRGADKFVPELESFVKDTVGLGERRNRVVHDPWFSLGSGGFQSRLEITARRKLRLQYVQVSSQDMANLLRDIKTHIERFMTLHDRILAALET